MPTYINFSSEIVPHSTEALIAVAADLANKKVDEVCLLLSTPGGSVMHGMTLYNVLRAMPFRLTTHNVGNVDSIGNAIFLAGEQRYACPHSTFMFHGVGFNTNPGERLEEKFVREKLDGILQDQKRIGSIIRERTNLNEGKIRNLFREARTKDANYALAAGIVHDVREVQIAPGDPIVTLVFKR